MRRKIALFASGTAGLSVARLLQENIEDEVLLLVLADQNQSLDAQIEAVFSFGARPAIFRGDLRSDPSAVIEIISNSDIDSLITVYWPFILPESVFRNLEITVNFHPALLPVNRGWYPHVHNILNGTAAGVTLHELSRDADTGAIWAQKNVEIFSWDTAGDLHARLQQEIIKLFETEWPKIRTKEIIPTVQSEDLATYNSKKALDSIDLIDLNEMMSAGKFINYLRARTFGPNGYAYFFDSGGNKVHVRIELDRKTK
jgi:methionyl-tRNA formyltransferase